VLRVRQIAGFGFRFAVLYAVLMAPWPGLSEAYGSFFRVVVQIAVVSADPERSVVVAPAGRSPRADTGPMLDTHILARIPSALHDSKAGVLESARSSRYTGYLPTVLAMALILATPLPWKRRAAALCGGTLLVTLFVACMPGIQFYAMFDRQDNHLVFEYIPWLYPHWKMLVHGLAKVSRWATPYYLVPILIWVFVAFRREEWMRVVEQLAANTRLGQTGRG
jgi:hypothetical protein